VSCTDVHQSLSVIKLYHLNVACMPLTPTCKYVGIFHLFHNSQRACGPADWVTSRNGPGRKGLKVNGPGKVKMALSLFANNTHTHIHLFTALWTLSGITWVSWYQKGKTNLDFTEARDCEWQWHQLGHMQICTSPQTDNHATDAPVTLPTLITARIVQYLHDYYACMHMKFGCTM